MGTRRRRPDKPQLSTLQRQITARRERLKLSQRALAKLIGVDQTSISHWESGRSSPRTSLLPLVAQALRTSIPALYREA